MIKVDTVLNAKWIIPIEPHGKVHEQHALAIDKGRIVDTGPQEELAQRYIGKETLTLNDHVLLPGFVNAHTHSPMVLFKGLADDLLLMDWLNNHIWPAEKKWLQADFVRDGTALAIAEMLRNGTTCFNEHYFYPEAIIEVAHHHKIRMCMGATIINFETSWSKNEQDGFEKFLHAYEKFKHIPLITFSLAPHAPYSTTDKILATIKDFSEDQNLPIHIHLHESAGEVQESLEKYGKRPLQRLYDLGLLSKRFQAVHMTQVTESDIELLHSTQTNIVHCPESNLKLASGYCPSEWLIQSGINTALGTDGAASNNNLDMIGEMRTAALIGKTVAESATASNAPQILRMATLNGARALGLDNEIGSIEVGKSADLIAINMNDLNTIPTYNPISQIVYSANNSQITDVWVAGKCLLRNQEFTSLDLQEVLAKTEKWRKRLIG